MHYATVVAYFKTQIWNLGIPLLRENYAIAILGKKKA